MWGWYAALAVLIAFAVLGFVQFFRMKRKGVCPFCVLRQYLLPYKLTMKLPEAVYENGGAATPPMGWSSWNTFRQKIDESIIRSTAQAMKDSGLVDAGYQYLNLDDCWHSSLRDENGDLQGDLTNFPGGIPALVKDVNRMGIKLGLYTSNGTLTCEDLPASLGQEKRDARTFARWGAEFFKYDYCHNIPLPGYAPCIEGISLGKAGASAHLVLDAADAKLTGMAKIISDQSLPSGHYLGGLGFNKGSAEFQNIEIPEAGEYVLTLLLKKENRKDKYLQVWVNGETWAETIVPGTKTWSPTGRQQLVVSLRKGKNSILLLNPVGTRADSAAVQYMRMGRELQQAAQWQAKQTGEKEKPIVYSICEWGRNLPWQWGSHAGNLWRTTPDIFPNWFSVCGIYQRTVGLGKYAGPGHWNDPDMLEVGNGKLTEHQNKTHFALWCMMAAPLILGNDIRKFLREDGTVDQENSTLRTVTNPDLIAIDQDPLGIPCTRVKRGCFQDILVRPLSGGRTAVCIVNRGRFNSRYRFSLAECTRARGIETIADGPHQGKELWSGKEFSASVLSGTLAPYENKLYLFS